MVQPACLMVSICLGYFTLLGPETANAGSLTVFMREDAVGKQIWLRDGKSQAGRVLTQGSGWHLYPDLAADGSRVAYVTGADAESLSVVTQDLATGKVTHWTQPGTYLHPGFSGDGRWLAFSGPVGPAGETRIGLIDLRQSQPDVRVVESTERSYFPALSSDGSFVVFQRSRDDGTRDVVELQLSSGKLRQITAPSGKSMAPELSFDDRYVVYTSLRNGNWDIYRFDRRSGGELRLTTNPGYDFAPTFTPAGDVVFASNRSGRFALYELQLGTDGQFHEERELILDANADLYAPSVSGALEFRQGEHTPMIAPARSSFGAVEHRGRIYVVGGHQGPEHTYPPESFVGRLEYFDLQTGTWHVGASRQVPCHGFDIVAHGNYLYAFGGFAYSAEHKPGWKSLDVIERYDIARDKWEIIAKMPRARSSNVVAQVGTKVWLIGGWDSTPQKPNDYEGRFHREIDVFDLQTETVHETSHQIPDPLRRAFTAVVRNDRIVLLGGLGVGSTHFELLDQVTEFDPATGEWRELPPLPFGTFAPAAGVLGDEIFVFGGMFKTGKWEYEYVNHIFSLNPGSSWKHSGRYLKETKGFAMVVNLSSTELGILGGHSYANDQDAPVATFETFGR